jgi:hypothetical protein
VERELHAFISYNANDALAQADAADKQISSGVTHLEMQRDQAFLETILGNPARDQAGEIVKAASARGNRQLVQGLSQHGFDSEAMGVYQTSARRYGVTAAGFRASSIFSMSGLRGKPAANAFW